MENSLAARESSPQGPERQPNCAERGVCAGDGKIENVGNGRRRFTGLTRRDRRADTHPRRTGRGREVVVLPSEHRRPEN
jgi:sirohydrochlorin ferrochelatase